MQKYSIAKSKSGKSATNWRITFSELETKSLADNCMEMFVKYWSANIWH